MPTNVSAATGPLLRHRWLRVLLIAAPGLMAAVAILVSMERNLAYSAALNGAAGVMVSSAIFIAVSVAARRVADDRVTLAQVTLEGQWRARAQLSSIDDEDTGMYTEWYFRLRLEEEIDRARRYGMPLSVLVTTSLGLVQHDGELAATDLNIRAIRRQLRKSDVPALLRDGNLAAILPHTPAAPALEARLKKALASRRVQIGVASYPTDGDTPETLVGAAMASARAQAQDSAALPA
jgi:GGDEF domain-containing protein